MRRWRKIGTIAKGKSFHINKGLEDMTRDRIHGSDSLPDEIRRQFRSRNTTRFLHALPWLQVDPDMPDRFLDLLAELDRTEAQGQNTRAS